MLGATTLVAAVVACSSGVSETVDDQVANSDSQSENLGTFEADPVDDLQMPEFDAAAYAAINPDTEIRTLIREADLRGEFDYYEEERIPRDAINPVYSPEFVAPGQATLRPMELVMGLEINGDARAYPVGMMRIREMVNDEVGGTPVLVTW
jgi:hypothetical protein